MAFSIDGLKPTSEQSFRIAIQSLMPNETPLIACQTSNGFLAVTNRRIVLLCEGKSPHYQITKSVPFATVSNYESLIRSFSITEPKPEAGETKIEVREFFQSTLRKCVDVIEKMKGSTSERDRLEIHDLSYLSDFPQSLTRDAILDLNTVLDDLPVDDALIARAVNFLGTDAILVEESLRDATITKNGILFAAGQKGYYWVRGQKQGRFLSNVIVDTVEWDNVQAIGQTWRNEQSIILVIYSLVSGGKPSTMEYQWIPPINEETLQVPWFVQPSNGPYLFEDIVFKYTGRKMNPSINSSF